MDLIEKKKKKLEYELLCYGYYKIKYKRGLYMRRVTHMCDVYASFHGIEYISVRGFLVWEKIDYTAGENVINSSTNKSSTPIMQIAKITEDLGAILPPLPLINHLFSHLIPFLPQENNSQYSIIYRDFINITIFF